MIPELREQAAPQDTGHRSPRRSRSDSRRHRRERGRSGGRRRSRSAGRGGGSYGFGKDKRNRAVCWFGNDCRRTTCWYRHPEGRGMGSRRRGRRSSSSSAESSSTSGSAKRVEPDNDVQGDTKSMRSTSTMTPSWLSFRDFVLQNLDDFESPEQAAAKYASFEAKVMSETMEKLRSSGLLLDLYSPIARVKQDDLVVSSGLLRAKMFVEDVEKQRFPGLSLLLAANSTVSSIGTHSVVHLQAPSFAFDPRVNAIAISKMVPGISVWEIIEILWKQPGFLSASKPRFCDDRLTRTYYARFETTSDAKAALKVLPDFQLNVSDEKQHELPCFELSASAESLEAFVLPPVMSSADRIKKDFDFTTEIARKLDGLLGIPADVTDGVLRASGSTEMKLDLQVLYLRRVHCFCFYSCAWCDDEWDLRDRCGAAFLRSDLSISGDDVAKAAGSKWAETHEARIQEFLATASFQKASLPSVDDDPNKGHWVAVIDSKIIEHSQEKYQCAICAKCFRDRRFGQKHLQKMHMELKDIALHRGCSDVVAAAFLADPKRPGWPPAKLELTGRAEGGA